MQVQAALSNIIMQKAFGKRNFSNKLSARNELNIQRQVSEDLMSQEFFRLQTLVLKNLTLTLTL